MPSNSKSTSPSKLGGDSVEQSFVIDLVSGTKWEGASESNVITSAKEKALLYLVFTVHG